MHRDANRSQWVGIKLALHSVHSELMVVAGLNFSWCCCVPCHASTRPIDSGALFAAHCPLPTLIHSLGLVDLWQSMAFFFLLPWPDFASLIAILVVVSDSSPIELYSISRGPCEGPCKHRPWSTRRLISRVSTSFTPSTSVRYFPYHVFVSTTGAPRTMAVVNVRYMH